MFINVEGVNYFILTENKSVNQIYREVFMRMGKHKVSQTEKNQIINKIKSQIKG